MTKLSLTWIASKKKNENSIEKMALHQEKYFHLLLFLKSKLGQNKDQIVDVKGMGVVF